MRKILLSIKPCYVDEILAGRKQVEYRKRIPKADGVSQVLIYSSHPVKKIVAEFTIGRFLSGTPAWLWDMTHGIGGVTKDVFDNYFEGRTVSYAYIIEKLHILAPQKTLADYGLQCGPQDYCYVEE